MRLGRDTGNSEAANHLIRVCVLRIEAASLNELSRLIGEENSALGTGKSSLELEEQCLDGHGTLEVDEYKLR